MERRAFFAACGGLVAASGAVAQPGGRETSTDRFKRFLNRQKGEKIPWYPADAPRIRKALKYGMIGAGATIEEKFAIARDAGFDGVELPSPNELDVDEVLGAKEKTGMEVPGVVDSVHWNKPLSHPDARVRTQGRHALETPILACKAYGGSTVLLVPAIVNAEISYKHAWDLSMEELNRVLPTAQDAGVSIAIENVWNNFLLSPLEATRYVDTLGGADVHGNVDAFTTPNGSYRRVVGWYFDIGNIVNYGWPEQWIDILQDRILKLDVKDFSRRKRDEEGLWKGFSVGIGEGDVDWKAVNAALDRIGFRGWAAAEVGGGGPERLREIAARMDRVFNIEADEP